jgi:hypothetical protein
MDSDSGPPVDRNDPRLHAYLLAADERRAEAELGRLLSDDAAPLLERVLRGHFGGAASAESELEDLQAAALLRLARQLLALRRGEAEAIESFAGYVAVTGFNAWRAWLRRRHPERARLHDRLRYLLTHDRDLALWPGRGGDWQCGLERLRPHGPLGRAPADREELARAIEDLPAGWDALGFPAQVRSLAERLGRPCRLADLASALAERLGLAEPEPSSQRSDDEDLIEAIADPGRGTVERLIGREYLAVLWREIRELPRAQRVALLLNLRDEGGQEMLGLLPLTGVAELPEIAAALALPEAELAAIWPELPRDDLWIAERLGLTRRQVINLRKSARARLARRMARR